MRNTTRAVIVLLVLAYSAGYGWAGSTRATQGTSAPQGQKSGQTGVITGVRTVSVRIVVEVPASRLRFRHAIEIPLGSRAVDALRSVYNVEQGLVCCDARDVRAINGLAVDPHREKWWVLKVNGNTQNTSSQTVLGDGDLLEAVYLEDEKYATGHVRLEDWVAGAPG